MIRYLALCLALVALLFSASSISAETNGWQASYFANASFDGDPILVRSVPKVDENWGAESPAGWFPVDNFSVRYTRTIEVSSKSIYNVSARADDGVKVYVDGELVLDGSGSFGQLFSADIPLDPGSYTVTVDFVETVGDAFVSANIQQVVNGQWIGEYFDRLNFNRPPVATRLDKAIAFDWGNGSPMPDVPNDNFLARWSRTIDVPKSAEYCFRASAKSGVRVYLNDERIINRWTSQGQPDTLIVELNAGINTLRVDYVHRTENAFIYFDYFPIIQFDDLPLNQWHGSFFNNQTLTGCPVAAQVTDDLGFQWGNQSPASQVQSDRWSSRWLKQFEVTQPTTYCFRASAASGTRVFLNDERIINTWNTTGAPFITEVELEPGIHTLQVNYVKRGDTNGFLYFDEFPLAQFPNVSSADWRVTYFNNPNLEGCPVATTTTEDINFDIGTDSPLTRVAGNRWSARYLGGINLDTTDTYCFSLRADDGARLWVDNFLLIDAWTGTARQTLINDIRLAKGFHNIRVEYRETIGDASLEFDYFPLSPLVDVYNVDSWHANYFNGRIPDGCPRATGNLDTLNVSWGTGSPDDVVNPNRFSAEFTRRLILPESTTYCFSAIADHGVRIFVDGERVVNAFNSQGAQIVGSKYLLAGEHDVRVEYNELTGTAFLNFEVFPIRDIYQNSAEPGEWLGFYYNGRNLSGCPQLIQSDASINFFWGEESPDEVIAINNFSAQWRKGIQVEETGDYCFTLSADHGARIFVNNERIINAWSRRNNTFVSLQRDVELEAGYNDLRVEYHDRTGNSWIQFDYTPGACEEE